MFFVFVCVYACSNYKLKHSSSCAFSSLKLIELKQKKRSQFTREYKQKIVCVCVKRKSEQQLTIA